MVEIRIELKPYEPNRVLCFDTSGVSARLAERFPEVEFADEWGHVGEYRRLEAFLKTHDAPKERKDQMLAQIRTKAVSNGPVVYFTIPSLDSEAITGVIMPRRVGFKCDAGIAEPLKSKFVAFLESLELGEVEIRD